MLTDSKSIISKYHQLKYDTGGLPRSVPSGGRVLGGCYIPAGYTVSAQAHTLHRDNDTFPDALTFNPDRWINPTQNMKDAYLPWGGGY